MGKYEMMYPELSERAYDASDEEVIEACLAWCNERRAEQGKEPLTELPKGRRSDPGSCPCGDATGLRVFSCAYGDPYGSQFISEMIEKGQTLPLLVREFVNRFDSGQFPQFDIDQAASNAS